MITSIDVSKERSNRMTEDRIPVYEATVASPSTNKGGVLKSTLTVNIGGNLSLRPNKVQPWRKNKVCIIDLDGQGNVLLTFGENPDQIENTIYDVLLNDLPAEDATIRITDNLDVIPANDDMAFFELDVLTSMANKDILSDYDSLISLLREMLDVISELKKFVANSPTDVLARINELEKKAQSYLNTLTRKIAESGVPIEDIYSLLAKAIEPLKNKYDYIIIDTPPQLGLIAGNVYNAAEDILIPFHPEKYSFRSMIKTINTINSWKKSNPELKVKAIIPVKLKEKTITHSVFLDTSAQMISTTDNQLGITKTIIPESIKPAEAITKYNLPFTMVDEADIRTKKEREPIIALKQVFDNLVDELGY